VLGGVGSEDFEQFIEDCGHAYNIVRRNGHLLLALFTLMLSTGALRGRAVSQCAVRS
jgi:hypothetical protein